VALAVGAGVRDDRQSLAGNLPQACRELRGLGEDVWFNLGDRDLAVCVHRARRLAAGERLTTIQQDIAVAFGVTARVLPMCDEPVGTRVRAHGRDFGLQEFLFREHGAGPVDGVEFGGAGRAHATDEVLHALADAEAIVIGPSNPVISIGPILALPGMRESLSAAPAPVVALSPFVGGRSVKGPSEHFCAWAGIETSAPGIARAYADVIDGVVADEPVEGVPALVMDTLMEDVAGMREVARRILEFGRALAS
jgi:LPPG:FO 2-phospho-L-lactate transferase